jgi:hypothetical protein
MSTSKDGACKSGQKITVITTGAETKDVNEFSSARIFAPAWHSSPGVDDDFTAFGKGVFHTKAYADELHTTCEHDGCLDRKVSRGSCYYAGEDFHIGHAVFCDVSEVECCGYIGCKTNRGKFENGTSHGYYYYAPGYVSRGTCCHCMASCDRSKENATAMAAGVCSYRDVTSKVNNCQREPNKDSLLSTTIGFLQCAVTSDLTVADMTVRETSATRAASQAASSAAGVRSPLAFSAMAALGAVMTTSSSFPSRTTVLMAGILGLAVSSPWSY